MSNEYKRLKEELDGADLDSMLPGFDREASWKELSPRLKKTANKTYVWRYAAALVVILIAAVLVRMQINKQSTDEQVATTIPPITMPAAADTNASVAQPKTEIAPVSSHAVAVQKTTIRKATPSPEIRKDEPGPQEGLIANTQEQPVESEALQPVEEPVVMQAKPVIKRPKAIHLLDIDNENRQAVIQNPKELQGGLPQRIVNLFPGRQYSNTDNARKPASLFKVN